MALPRSADYSSKDFDSIRLRLQALIRSVFPTWTDFETTNFGNILTDMSAFVLDVVAFTQDNQALESRIATAVQRRNLLALCKLINYIPSVAAPAHAAETFTATGLLNNCTIPAGTVIKTGGDAIPFQLLSPLLLTPGAPSNTGDVENSITQTQLYNATGQPFQTVVLPESPFLSVASVSLGGGWSKVSNFLFSGATDKVYTLTVDNNDRATLAFGDGVNGAMPSGAMTVIYKTGGGSAGNVAPNSITEIQGAILDTLGNLVSLTATNAARATEGADRESNASIRLRAPLSITNPTSSIARTDFEVHALQIPSVARALMLTANEDPSIADNSGSLYVVPIGNPPAAPSATLLEQVDLQFQGDTQARPLYPKPLTFNLATLPPVYVSFDITAKIYLKRNADPTTVSAAIHTALLNFFNPIVDDEDRAKVLGVEVGALNPLIDFGYYLSVQNPATVGTHVGGFVELSDLMDAVHDVDGVRGIGTLSSDFTITATRLPSTAIVIAQHVDVPLDQRDFPIFGSVTVVNIDTGSTI